MGNGNGMEIVNKLMERVMSVQQLVAVLESLKAVVAALTEKVSVSVENSSRVNDKLVEQLQAVVKAVDGVEGGLKGMVEHLPNKEDLNQDCNECALLKERSKTVTLLKKWLVVVSATLFGVMATVAGLKLAGIAEALVNK